MDLQLDSMANSYGGILERPEYTRCDLARANQASILEVYVVPECELINTSFDGISGTDLSKDIDD